MKQSTNSTPASQDASGGRCEVSQPRSVHGDWLLDEALQETFRPAIRLHPQATRAAPHTDETILFSIHSEMRRSPP
jgi:hypothetical protein